MVPPWLPQPCHGNPSYKDMSPLFVYFSQSHPQNINNNSHHTTLLDHHISKMAKGAILKFVSLFVRAIQFGCAAVILGIWSYFLATLSNHKLPINNHAKATEGISGAATVYTILGFLLVCCLGSITAFGFLSILLDFAFAGAFGYIAWVNRNGAGKCSGVVDTPYGYGSTTPGNRLQDDDAFTNLPSFRTACRLQTAAFSVAIIGG